MGQTGKVRALGSCKPKVRTASVEAGRERLWWGPDVNLAVILQAAISSEFWSNWQTDEVWNLNIACSCLRP